MQLVNDIARIPYDARRNLHFLRGEKKTRDGGHNVGRKKTRDGGHDVREILRRMELNLLREKVHSVMFNVYFFVYF